VGKGTSTTGFKRHDADRWNDSYPRKSAGSLQIRVPFPGVLKLKQFHPQFLSQLDYVTIRQVVGAAGISRGVQLNVGLDRSKWDRAIFLRLAAVPGIYAELSQGES
jgi:hypothetical protein